MKTLYYLKLFAEEYSPRGEYSPTFTEPEANNCFSIITQVIIREKQKPSEKCRFCLFVSNCHASMNKERSLPITCSIEITCSIDKLHMAQAECQ